MHFPKCRNVAKNNSQSRIELVPAQDCENGPQHPFPVSPPLCKENLAGRPIKRWSLSLVPPDLGSVTELALANTLRRKWRLMNSEPESQRGFCPRARNPVTST